MNSVALNFLKTVKEWNRIQIRLCCRSSGGVTDRAHTAVSPPHTHAPGRRFDPCSHRSSSSSPVNKTVQPTNRRKAQRWLQPRSSCAERHRLGPSAAVGNNTTQHLPINPRLSPRHGWSSACLGLLYDSRFEGTLLWLDVVKKKDVGRGEEALLCLRGLCYGRSTDPLKIWNLRMKHDLNDRWCHFFIFLDEYDVSHALLTE